MRMSYFPSKTLNRNSKLWASLIIYFNGKETKLIWTLNVKLQNHIKKKARLIILKCEGLNIVLTSINSKLHVGSLMMPYQIKWIKNKEWLNCRVIVTLIVTDCCFFYFLKEEVRMDWKKVKNLIHDPVSWSYLPVWMKMYISFTTTNTGNFDLKSN